MSSYASDYLRFIEFLSSHTPPWVTLINIAIGFCLCSFLLSLSLHFVVHPYKSQMRREIIELDSEMLEIVGHDRDGWSRKLIERKTLKMDALNKKLALNSYHWMLWVGIIPDVYTFPCVLRTCGGIQDLCRGREVHAHVVRTGFESHIDVINALITMYVKRGDIYSARLLFDKMCKKDRITWNAMVSGFSTGGSCKIHKIVELGELAAKYIFEKNLHWVEVKGSVHAFLSGDESHPQIKEMKGVLEVLDQRMKKAGSEILGCGSLIDKPDFKSRYLLGAKREADCWLCALPGMPIRVTKNLYMCGSCHNTMKFISKIVRRKIQSEILSNSRWNLLSCGDEGYWRKLSE